MTLMVAAITLGISGCKKGEEDVVDCEEDNTATVKFTNTTDVPMRVKVAYQLTPQFEPIDPVVTIDLAPGQSISEDIDASRYFILWYNNCSTSCNRVANYSRTYEICGSYEEMLPS